MPRDYREQFAARVSTARRHGGFTQQEIADLLGVQISTFAKYEKRANAPSPTMLPLWLVENFCLACRVRIDWLITGKGRMQARRHFLGAIRRIETQD